MLVKVVKVGSVSLKINEWKNPRGKINYRFTYKDHNLNKKSVTRANLDDAVSVARETARQIHNGNRDLAGLNDADTRLVRAFLEMSPSWEDLERFREMKTRASINVEAAASEFMNVKTANRGRSHQHTKTLKSHIGKIVTSFEGRDIASINVAELDSWINSFTVETRTKKNIRAAVVTFFRWARSRDYLPDTTTQAEKMERPIIRKSTPLTYSPPEIYLMIDNVSEKYRPWLVLAAFQGIRVDELYPMDGSDKVALKWENLDWDRMIIKIPPEVDKNGNGRVQPIRPIVKKLLYPHCKASGRITGLRLPYKVTKSIESETKRLGSLVGGWRDNALRHSAISYLCALQGVAMTALHCGNSETQIKTNYLDAKSRDQALEYFGELRENS